MAELEHAGVPLYGVNLAVGVSLTMPGIAADIAEGVMGNLPFGAQSIAGVRCTPQHALQMAFRTLPQGSLRVCSSRSSGAQSRLVQGCTFLSVASCHGSS